ncbi:hypothetical protein M408DRAFT_30431 [Serendipita vermifera MAFF 305830]|uniref:PNPLA domain-containing protein n=1 Tax=Serendipita vermifera MAFF 305830 TaxID=933852 RepID=A0A0C3AM26_SERVB|nr:hypothetical protein M408DRAFT_30431 [Serendipita vermifera MAFF 305830]
MPLYSALTSCEANLCLLSFDAGGARGITQLKILTELMRQLNFNAGSERHKRPGDAFNVIGGVGTGGFITILLVVLGFDANKALEEFITISANVLENGELGAQARTTTAEEYIRMLKKWNLREVRDYWIQIIAQTTENWRFLSHTSTMLDLTAFSEALKQAKALPVTLATPSLFTSVSISKDSATFEYAGGDLNLGYPTAESITEAYGVFGPKAQVACIPSMGSGYLGTVSVPEGSDLATWNTFLFDLVKDSENISTSITVSTLLKGWNEGQARRTLILDRQLPIGLPSLPTCLFHRKSISVPSL